MVIFHWDSFWLQSNYDDHNKSLLAKRLSKVRKENHFSSIRAVPSSNAHAHLCQIFPCIIVLPSKLSGY
jgi:hypothetical protein